MIYQCPKMFVYIFPCNNDARLGCQSKTHTYTYKFRLTHDKQIAQIAIKMKKISKSRPPKSEIQSLAKHVGQFI